MQNTSLTQRLVVAIVAPVVLLLALGALLFLQILRMSETARWVEHSDEVIAWSSDVQRQITDQETGLRGYLLANDREFLEPYLRAHTAEGFARLQALVVDNPAQSRRVEAAHRAYETWLARSAPLTEPGARLETGRDLATLKDRKRSMDQVREAMNDVLRTERELRDARAITSDAAGKTTLRVLVPSFIALALVIAAVVRRQIGGVAGEYRSALDAERATKEVQAAQSAVRAAHVDVSEGIQGDLSVDDVGQAALAALVEHTGAVVAAFYVPESDGIKCRAGYGIDPAAAKTFKPGEGVVGQVEREKRLRHYADMPNDYLRVESGTGACSPVDIVVFPACAEGRVEAILELGFLRAASEHEREIFERVAETIGTAVRSAGYKARLRDLLEESQRQGEELQAQQEELRVANEELQQQGDALRTAHGQVEERNEELVVSNSAVEAQRSALLQVQVDLREKATALEKANRYKSEFLANMSHELRTPLNSSLILAKLLADNKSGNLTDEQVKYAHTIHSSNSDLLVLINDVLDLSKIEAGRVEVQLAPTTLERLIEPVTRMFEPIAQTKGISFFVEIDEPERSLQTDVQRTQQILKNLLSNAFKFTDKGEVRFGVSSDRSGFTFSVSDTGIGIRHDQQEVIFEAFRQADGTTNRRFSGTGLGLSISRDLAELLGGDLSVESRPGQGSRFTFRLPANASDAQGVLRPTERTRTEPPPLAKFRSDPPSKVDTSPPRPRTTPAVADDRDHLDRRRRVLLIVEDDIPFAEILVSLARELEFQFLLAHDADEGIRMAFEYVPSAIVLDVRLPDHSGLSVIDRVKRAPETRHIPIHVISAFDHATEALSMGAIGFVQKPVSRDKLVTMLSELKDRFARVRRLLVVEDDSSERNALGVLLGGEGIEIVAVASVHEALERLRSSTFDCIVTDLTLADGTGYDLLEKMAGGEEQSFPPVIVYTASSMSAEDEHRLRRYSSSIIVKGARSPERLVDEVTLFLHQVESDLPVERQRMLRQARDREALFEGRTILITDDDVRNVFALTSVLEPKGANVLIARNGREALERLDATPEVDLVLMDIIMPEMDGLQAITEIRKRGERGAKLPIIALTAKVMSDDQQRCLNAGANDYIAKPFDVEMLVSLIRVWIPK